MQSGKAKDRDSTREPVTADRQLQSIIDNTPDVVYAMDLEGRFMMANAALGRLLGFAPEQLLGKKRHEFMPSKDADWHEANDREVIKAGTAREFEEYSELNGRSITWLTKKFPLRDAQGIIYAVGGISADISERKRAESEREELIAQLKDAERRKDEFIAVLSHELRNPLAPISHSLYILDRAEPGGEQAERAKRVIARQVAQLFDLVNDLLEVTRITHNKIQLQKEPIELNEVAHRAVEDLHSVFEQAAVQLELTPAPNPIALFADRTRASQILSNLLQNSAKFTDKGGHTRVVVAVEGQDAVVRVTDDGVGMSRETLDRLFQPFSQAQQLIDRSKGGLGLGLALVKALVELHGGTVSARSEGLGRGSEFIVRLPMYIGAH